WAPPAAPSNLTAAAASSSQIDLTWTNNASDATGVKVERATDSGFTQNLTAVATTAANVTAYSDTTVAAATTYFYRVRATNAAAASPPPNAARAPPAPPAAPSNLVATAVSASQIGLAWADNASNETKFKLERSADNVTWTYFAAVGADVTAYTWW